VLYLRLRRAVNELGVPLVDLAPIEHELSPRAAHVARTVPGEGVDASVRDAIGRVVEGRSGPVVVILGRSNVAAHVDAVLASAAELARVPDVRFLSALRRGNVHGALDAGLAPGFLPGRVTLERGREWFAKQWGGTPKERGLDAEGMLRAAADGKLHVLVLLGADPINDFPDAELARRAIDSVPTIIAVDAFDTESTRRADVFLPCALWGEKCGTVTNIEGRVQRVGQKVAAEGTAMDDWRIAVELALRLGQDLDLATTDEVTNELARVAPAFVGADAALLKRARDGVVLPLRDHLAEVVLRARDLTIMSDDGQGTSWDPIKVAGEVPADSTNAVEASGAGAEPLKPGFGDPDDDARPAAQVLADAEAATRVPNDMPDLHAWDRSVPAGDVPGRDTYALRLVVGRALYDKGRIVSETPILQRLVQERELRVHPNDLARIGVDSGGQVNVTSARGSQVVMVEADPSVPAGTAAFDFTADAHGPALLIDASLPVTDIRIESMR
jgi:NADH-quinone oxidoreductase subunit G